MTRRKLVREVSGFLNGASVRGDNDELLGTMAVFDEEVLGEEVVPIQIVHRGVVEKS